MTNTVLRWVSARNLPAENRKKNKLKQINRTADKQNMTEAGDFDKTKTSFG